VTFFGEAISIQSIAVNAGGDGIVTFDAPGGVGGVIVDEDMANSPPATGAIGLGDRVVTGPKSDLKAPKGLEADIPGGLYLVADVGAADIKAFDFDDEGDVQPKFEISDLGGSPAVWDIHYVALTDTLYAAGTNGVVQVYEDFSNSLGQGGPDRSITPAQNGVKISINLHGIDVVDDTLYLSDVGDANNAADGQLFVIDGADAADGLTEVDQRIQGGKLGNPVDLELRPGVTDVLYVVEKSNDALLTYTENLNTGDLEPTLPDFMVVKPESVARITNTRLMVASNPAGLDADRALVISVPNPAVTSTLDRLGSVSSVQSVVLSPSGAGLVSFDGPAVSGGGGIFVVPGLTGLVGNSTASAVAGRIWGPAAGIVAPKGLGFGDTLSHLFVADLGAAAVKVFDSTALGDTAPLFALADFGAAPWDMDYDPGADRLFVAGVDGVVYVFDDVLLNAGGAPTRTITPSDDGDQKISVNLHGIQYDAASNALLVSDVGDAANATDGQLFVIAGADAAQGPTAPQLVLKGDQTKFGNPVDLAFDGVNVYIAEKANSLVLRFDGVLDLVGTLNQAADASFAVQNAESVQLAFTQP
jgi:hypothetical protein